MPKPIRVAMLARVVYPLHGFGGIEHHVFHLTTHFNLSQCGFEGEVRPLRFWKNRKGLANSQPKQAGAVIPTLGAGPQSCKEDQQLGKV